MSRPTDSDVVRQIRIEASPEDVFSYFTDPARLVVWKAVTADAEARPGGRFRMDVTGRGDIASGEYLDIEPPHRIRFTWHWDNDSADTPPGVVDVTLTPDGDGTLLRLVHRGINALNRETSAAGWEHYLARLRLAAAGHDPGPDPWARPAAGSPIEADRGDQ